MQGGFAIASEPLHFSAAMFEGLRQRISRQPAGVCGFNLRQKNHYPNGHSAK